MRRTAHSFSSQSHGNTGKERYIHNSTVPLPGAGGCTETVRSSACWYVCAWVHKKSLLRSLMRLKEWNGSLLKQQWINLFPHTVNQAHLRWGLGPGRPAGASSPADSAVLWGPPAVTERDEGASSRDENPSNQTTQVVHLGGQLLKASGKQKRAFIHHW